MDIQMPDLTGLQLSKNCKEQNQYYDHTPQFALQSYKLMRLIIYWNLFEFERFMKQLLKVKNSSEPQTKQFKSWWLYIC
jgi:CheY-like chemotaxis protein